MKIAIIGAGAMGSIFGSMLSGVSDVFLITTNKEHVNAINKNGLKIEENDGSFKKYKLFASNDPKEINGKVDLAIIFTKSYHTKDAAISAVPILQRDGLALTLQNGLGNNGVISDIIGEKRTVAGVTSHGGTLVKPGLVRHAGTGPTHFSGPGADPEKVARVAEVFNAAGIETSISDNLDTLIWGKLIINVGINALTAILRVQNGIIGVTPECEKIMEKAVSEAVKVAGALGIHLPYTKPFNQVKKVCKKTAQNRASMLQDVLKGSRTEVGVINRAIVSNGLAMGIPTPYNLFLSEIIEALEATMENRCI